MDEGGREGGMEGGREGWREGGHTTHIPSQITYTSPVSARDGDEGEGRGREGRSEGDWMVEIQGAGPAYTGLSCRVTAGLVVIYIYICGYI